MPLYEYVCQDCEAQAELLVSSTREPECPACGSRKLTKLLSVVASPTRDGSAPGASPKPPGGSCGPSCGCHPHR
jgi:putative FmdB family regulatory protein